MSKLKYGKLYMNKGDILEAMRLPIDAHLEIIGDDQLGGIEFNVITSGDVEHECLTTKEEDGTAFLRRFKVPIEHKKDSWTMTDEQLEKSLKFAELLLMYDKMGIAPNTAVGIIRNSVEQ
ncbi:hypothetical protein [Sporosarcina sp. FSL W7-1283]|uniref:hypothetical protein n=1 Tax=Sporosarcina sp. FSL W7-1283 TaxID=2921560 RepID=UPI0030FBE986